VEGHDNFIKVLFLTLGTKADPKPDSEILDMDTTLLKVYFLKSI